MYSLLKRYIKVLGKTHLMCTQYEKVGGIVDEFSSLPSPTPVDLPEVKAAMKPAFVFGLMPHLFEPRSKGDGSDKEDHGCHRER